MKLLVFVAVTATLTMLATGQDEKKCPDELRTAAENAFDVCNPVLKCDKKALLKGQHHQESGSANRRRRQENEQEPENVDKAQMIQKCLDKIQEESAFADIIEKCSVEEVAEKRLLCIHHEFGEECPEFKSQNGEQA